MSAWTIVPEQEYFTAADKALAAVNAAPGLSMLSKEARIAIVRLIIDSISETVER